MTTSKEQTEIMLLVDGFTTSFSDFLEANTGEDVEEISKLDIEAVENLKIDESIYIGICEVKRIK